tara:strand:- start:4532 stop:5749 length:1218 start_codon:yes stop_codon:yes gene_type:complete
LRAWCNEVETDLEANIVPSEITVNQDFTFAGYKAKDLGGVRFSSQSSASTGSSNTNLLEVVSEDLYFVDGSGNSIRVTNGGALDITTTGGIGGNYTTTTAEVTYSSADTEYTFSDHNTPARPAGIQCGIIRVREEAASTNAVSIQSPGSLSSAYAITLPTGVGSGTQVVTSTTSGSAISLAVSSSLALTGTIEAASGMKFKASGSGSDTLTHFEDKGTTSSARGFDPTVAGASAATLTYTKRYAYYQKIGEFVHAFVSIIFTSNWSGSVASKIRVSGLPYKAKGDSIGTTTGNIVACGSCVNYPPAGLGAQSGYVAASSGASPTSVAQFCPQVVPVMIDDDADVYFMKSGIMDSMTANVNNEWDGSATPPTSSGTAMTNSLGVTLANSGTHYITFSITYRAGGAA